MRDLFILLVFLSFFWYGIRAPFVLLLGYVWVDIFTPQLVSYGFLRTIPVSQVIGIVAFITIVLNPPPIRLLGNRAILLMFVFGLWMTLTLLWAEVPIASYEKWNWALKNVWVACLVPLFIRSRIELEALIWTIVLAGMANCIPFGIKILISGGGYGQAKGLIEANSGYGESSTLAMFAVTLIPLCLYLIKHSQIITMNIGAKLMLWGFILSALLTSLGTFARTGLVCSAILGIALFLRSKRKLQYATVTIIAVIALSTILGDQWAERMNTISDGTDTSSMGRIAAWMWAWEYVQTNPFGGSFRVEQINYFVMTLSNGQTLEISGKAFHNIFFEVLAETGFPGIFLFSLITITSILSLNRTRKISSLQEHEWIRDISATMLISIIIFLAGGMFIGIAFQSYFYYLASVSVVIMNIYALENTKSAALTAY
jgi:probable O-glycosylation ligase (exosortase A-associated)